MLSASAKRANRNESSEFIISVYDYGRDFPANPASNQVLEKRPRRKANWVNNLVEVLESFELVKRGALASSHDCVKIN